MSERLTPDQIDARFSNRRAGQSFEEHFQWLMARSRARKQTAIAALVRDVDAYITRP